MSCVQKGHSNSTYQHLNLWTELRKHLFFGGEGEKAMTFSSGSSSVWQEELELKAHVGKTHPWVGAELSALPGCRWVTNHKGDVVVPRCQWGPTITCIRSIYSQTAVQMKSASTQSLSLAKLPKFPGTILVWGCWAHLMNTTEKKAPMRSERTAQRPWEMDTTALKSPPHCCVFWRQAAVSEGKSRWPQNYETAFHRPRMQSPEQLGSGSLIKLCWG